MPTLDQAFGWGIVIGVGAATAVGVFLFVCALFGIDFDCGPKDRGL